ncbi:MAG: glycogen synthase [Flavobacteriia bacterium]|nr:MAG: glycogen synthase [Flavobacteriia bacterium]
MTAKHKKPKNIFFISVECYPIAKVGGLADVVGSLPKYLNQLDLKVSVVMPQYDLPWFADKTLNTVYEGHIHFPNWAQPFHIKYYKGDDLGFEVYFVDLPGLFFRKGVYADEHGVFFHDETERYIAFQRAVLQWFAQFANKPDLIHCHDHHTGLIPFMMKYAYEFAPLKDIPTVFSIHNENYQGTFSWGKQYLLPAFDVYKSGELDWEGRINPLACAVKCSWKLNTVSPSYMDELKHTSHGLEQLFHHESHKSQGILNGIDTDVWNPSTDPMLDTKYVKSLTYFKSRNKAYLLNTYGLEKGKTLISFIGRFALEKGADVLPHAIDHFLAHSHDAVFIILGTGMADTENYFKHLEHKYPNRIKSLITYDETVSHRIYAGSDFIIMPSRVEPCGLNQMYAMRYGTIPVVRNTGGLKDSVVSIDEKNGTGIKFDHVNSDGINYALFRAVDLYKDQKHFTDTRNRCFKQNFSWKKSAQHYKTIYNELI